MRRTALRRIGALLALVFLGLVAAPAVSAGEPPRIVFTGSEDGVHMRVRSTDLAGVSPIRLSRDAEPFVSINGGLAAYTRHDRQHIFASDVFVKDAATGDLRYTVEDARFPLIFDGGTALLFLPDNNGRLAPADRDAFVNSVWYKDLLTGEETKLAQLQDPDPDRHVLHLAASADGQQVAFTHGEDSFLFVWNIWISNVGGTGLEQLTTDDRSLYPSFSPDGQTLAFMHLNPARRCSGSVYLMDTDGANANPLSAGSCDAVWLRPVWLDDQTLVVWRWERVPHRPFNRPAGLVTMSAQTGEVLSEIVTGPVFDFGVAREAGLVAFRMKNGRIGVYDVASGTTSPVPGGKDFPFGHLHIDGSLELAF